MVDSELKGINQIVVKRGEGLDFVCREIRSERISIQKFLSYSHVQWLISNQKCTAYIPKFCICARGLEGSQRKIDF